MSGGASAAADSPARRPRHGWRLPSEHEEDQREQPRQRRACDDPRGAIARRCIPGGPHSAAAARAERAHWERATCRKQRMVRPCAAPRSWSKTSLHRGRRKPDREWGRVVIVYRARSREASSATLSSCIEAGSSGLQAYPQQPSRSTAARSRSSIRSSTSELSPTDISIRPGWIPIATRSDGSVPRSSASASTSRRSIWCGESLRPKRPRQALRAPARAASPAARPASIASRKRTALRLLDEREQVHSPGPAIHQAHGSGQAPLLAAAAPAPRARGRRRP